MIHTFMKDTINSKRHGWSKECLRKVEDGGATWVQCRDGLVGRVAGGLHRRHFDKTELQLHQL